jgi:multisubunit Na+/H+ antiporter MnhG subunit
MTPCDHVAERLALGEALGELDAHVATCPACTGLVRMPTMFAATAHAAEPAPGFSARMTVGARGRIAARRRNRMATITAAAAAVFLIGGSVASREPARSLQGAMRPLMEMTPLDSSAAERPVAERPADDVPATTDDELAAALVRLADVDGALLPATDWSRIEAPLAPYRILLSSLQGAQP